MLATATNCDSLRLLITSENNPIIFIEEIIKRCFRGTALKDVKRLLLTRLGPAAVPVNKRILIDAVRTGQIPALELLLEQRYDLNLQEGFGIIWQAPNIDPFWLT